jgi:hypothetical protein
VRVFILEISSRSLLQVKKSNFSLLHRENERMLIAMKQYNTKQTFISFIPKLQIEWYEQLCGCLQLKRISNCTSCLRSKIPWLIYIWLVILGSMFFGRRKSTILAYDSGCQANVVPIGFGVTFCFWHEGLMVGFELSVSAFRWLHKGIKSDKLTTFRIVTY